MATEGSDSEQHFRVDSRGSHLIVWGMVLDQVKTPTNQIGSGHAAPQGKFPTVKPFSLLFSTLVLASVYVLIPAQAAAEPAMGSPTAPVTLVEYGSLTCGYCVRFHRDILPHLKREYIDTGRVRYIFRDFPTSAQATRGAVAARCVSSEAYYPTLNALFSSVGRWSRTSDVDAALQREGMELGLNMAEFRKCLKDPASEVAVAQSRRQAAQELDVLGTPTFLINGRIVRGAQTLEQIEALIANASL